MPRRSAPRRLALALCFLTASMAAGARAQTEPAPAPAAPPPPAAGGPIGNGFGAQGVWVFTFETADNGSGYFFFHKTSGGGSSVNLNPGADYFLAPNISVGANISYSHDSGGGGTVFGAGVRAGYDLNITDAIGFWPTARFFVSRNDNAHLTSTAFGVLAPFLWHAAPHFFLGAGPDLNVGVSGPSYTEYGIDFMLGGWL